MTKLKIDLDKIKIKKIYDLQKEQKIKDYITLTDEEVFCLATDYYSGWNNFTRRELIKTIIYDDYSLPNTIIYSVCGSPPKGIAMYNKDDKALTLFSRDKTKKIKNIFIDINNNEYEYNQSHITYLYKQLKTKEKMLEFYNDLIFLNENNFIEKWNCYVGNITLNEFEIKKLKSTTINVFNKVIEGEIENV